jgi:hypothetical protein
MDKILILRYLYFSLALSSCSQIVSPQDEWSEPVDFSDYYFEDKYDFLKIVKKYRFSLECGQELGFFSSEIKWEPYYQNAPSPTLTPKDEGMTDESPRISSNASCSGFARIIKSMGGQLWEDPQIAPSSPPLTAPKIPPSPLPTIKVKLFEHPPEKDTCGGDVVLMILTFGIYPCVDSIQSKIDLSLTADSGKMSLKKTFTAQVKSIAGIPALSFVVADLFRSSAQKSSARKSRLAQDFVRSVQNNFATFLIRLERTPEN